MKLKSSKKPKIIIVEEIFNSVSHGLVAIAGITALVIGITTLASPLPLKVGFIVYIVSLILLMTASSLYHALTFTKASRIFRLIDHNTIYVLIAGSFTPFIIYLFHGWPQALLLTGIWLIAVGGIVVTTLLVIPRDMKITGVLIYIVFGWLGLLFIPRIDMLNASIILLVLSGGIIYTLGTVPFALKKPFTHFSWHIFVATASVLHFFAIIKLY